MSPHIYKYWCRGCQRCTQKPVTLTAKSLHEGYLTWKRFPHYCLFLREYTAHLWIPLPKNHSFQALIVSCQLDQNIEQTVALPTIWDVRMLMCRHNKIDSYQISLILKISSTLYWMIKTALSSTRRSENDSTLGRPGSEYANINWVWLFHTVIHFMVNRFMSPNFRPWCDLLNLSISSIFLTQPYPWKFRGMHNNWPSMAILSSDLL